MKQKGVSDAQRIAKGFLLALLVIFSGAAIIFSVIVIFTDLGQRRPASQSESQARFYAFVRQYIDEVNPRKAAPGHKWQSVDVSYDSSNSATVIATDTVTKSELQFIYLVEGDNVRVLKINDITDQGLQDAQLAVIRYLDFLRMGNGVEAALLYGGPGDRLTPYGVPGTALPELFLHYCANVSPTGTCLPFTIHDHQQDNQSGLFRFVVTYQLPSGGQFTLPNGKKDFEVSVRERSHGDYVVVSLPFD